MDKIYLQGAEDVYHAGINMQNAAQDITRAVERFSEDGAVLCSRLETLLRPPEISPRQKYEIALKVAEEVCLYGGFDYERFIGFCKMKLEHLK